MIMTKTYRFMCKSYERRKKNAHDKKQSNEDSEKEGIYRVYNILGAALIITEGIYFI